MVPASAARAPSSDRASPRAVTSSSHCPSTTCSKRNCKEDTGPRVRTRNGPLGRSTGGVRLLRGTNLVDAAEEV